MNSLFKESVSSIIRIMFSGLSKRSKHITHGITGLKMLKRGEIIIKGRVYFPVRERY